MRGAAIAFIVIMFGFLVWMWTTIIQQENRQSSECASKGGLYRYDHGGSICLSPGTFIPLKE